ncbi:complexin-1 isoform X1 [Herpailurus yagouaroundi]|uniref:complexin-1 isoform X1 n=1 Tax=Felis catus TaxID=9685 RepID=UPI00094856B1|nr:complexin-1 isoform X1 [Felis catus]XP_040345899.1 complexin-1 isoform X1 [Puma yagouaroundi]
MDVTHALPTRDSVKLLEWIECSHFQLVFVQRLSLTEHSVQHVTCSCRVHESHALGATKDMGKMLGGDEEKDPDAAKKEEERQEALRQEEEERKAKYAKMEAEREAMRQGIRDKYGIKKKEEREAEAQAAMEANSEGSLTRPKKAIPPGCGDEPEEEDESILDTVIKYLPGPLQDMFKK